MEFIKLQKKMDSLELIKVIFYDINFIKFNLFIY